MTFTDDQHYDTACDDRPDCTIAEHHAVEDIPLPWSSTYEAEPDADRGWCVGRHQPRNVYLNGAMVAVFVGADDEAAVLAAEVVDTLNVAAVSARPRCKVCGWVACSCTVPFPLVGVQSAPVDPPITLAEGVTNVVVVTGLDQKPRVTVSPGECGAAGPDNLRCQRNAGHLERTGHAHVDEVHGLVKW